MNSDSEQGNISSTSRDKKVKSKKVGSVRSKCHCEDDHSSHDSDEVNKLEQIKPKISRTERTREKLKPPLPQRAKQNEKTNTTPRLQVGKNLTQLFFIKNF